jgi:hypothetical protein
MAQTTIDRLIVHSPCEEPTRAFPPPKGPPAGLDGQARRPSGDLWEGGGCVRDGLAPPLVSPDANMVD